MGGVPSCSSERSQRPRPSFIIHLNFHDSLDDITEHFLHGRHDLRRAGEVLALNVFLQ